MRSLGILIVLLLAVNATGAPQADAGDAQIPAFINALSGPDAVAEASATQKLLQLGDNAVPALAKLAGDPGPLAPRLIAVELLGRIGTPPAVDALLAILPAEKNLAVRGQVCIQLGYAGDARAVPVIAEWFKTIGPRALDDLRGPKELQPSTCYIRHVEALGMIGDERAIPILEDFVRKIPPGIGVGGFLSNFVTGAVNETLEDLKDRAAFMKSVRKHDGLEQAIRPLLNHLRRDRVARFRLAEDEVIRHTSRGKSVLDGLVNHREPAIAAAAKALLFHWDQLAP